MRIKRSKLLIAGAALVAAGCLSAWLFSDALITRAAALLIQSRAAKALQLNDGLHVFLIGTGSPMPDKNRAGPCIAVQAGRHLFLVDAGDGTAKNIRLMKLPIGTIEAVFLTHFHSDHIGGLGEIMLQRWAGGANTSPLPVYGPPGVEKVVAGFNMAYELDSAYRVAHHGPSVVPSSGSGGIAKIFTIDAPLSAATVVYHNDGITIRAFNVDHSPVVPAVGYTFEYKGKIIAITGDTKYSPSLQTHVRNADMVICEMLNVRFINLINRYTSSKTTKAITRDIITYHITPEQAARMAATARVKNLVFYHIIPPMPIPLLKGLYLGDAKKYFDNPITMGEDGMHFFLPIESDGVERNNLLN